MAIERTNTHIPHERSIFIHPELLFDTSICKSNQHVHTSKQAIKNKPKTAVDQTAGTRVGQRHAYQSCRIDQSDTILEAISKFWYKAEDRRSHVY
jgi:hypothetical protein